MKGDKDVAESRHGVVVYRTSVRANGRWATWMECVQCGEKFLATRSDAKRCGARCRKRAQRDRLDYYQ